MDIINATTQAYKTAWQDRDYLLRLAAIPLIVKFFCFLIASAVTEETNFIRFTLFMIPAYLAEGWMLAHIVRTAVLDHRWPYRPTGNMEADMAALKIRARGVLSGMIVYVLINMTIALLAGAIYSQTAPYMASTPEAAAQEMPVQTAYLVMFFMALLFWGFRWIWLYIPYSLNMGVAEYVRGLRSISYSFRMMGIWIACFIPIFLAIKFLGALVGTLAIGLFGEAAAEFVVMLMTTLIDTLKAILTTLGITYALRELFSAQNKKL